MKRIKQSERDNPFCNFESLSMVVPGPGNYNPRVRSYEHFNIVVALIT